jgi:hypothetical protein
MRSAAVLVVALAVGCQASPPTSPDATPDSVPITIAQISQPPSGLLSPGAVLAPNTQVRIGGSYFLTEPDLQSIRRTVWVYACPGHDAASFRTFCSGEGQKPTLGRTLFTADLAYPGMPLDIQFIHILLIEETELGDSLLPRPFGTVTSTHYPISNVLGRLLSNLALEYPLHWQ